MPVARIYASLVEEAEPICADLLARGYHVEIVFPDAVLPTPADLELRVERCSAEQAIARVEADGSPSRCVFVTQSKGPQRELLLVEMTVLGNGTEGRHPIAMPSLIRVEPALPLALTPPAKAADESATESPRSTILPFPDSPKPTEVGTEIPERADVRVNELTGTEGPSARPRDGETLSRSMMVELNAFLAHAPVVERPDGLHLKIFENVRHSVGVARARKNWEGLTLAGVASSFLLLLSLGWYAAPPLARRASASQPERVALPVATLKKSVPISSPAPPAGVGLLPVSLETQTADAVPPHPAARYPRRTNHSRRFRRDDFVAVDSVVRLARQTPGKSISPKAARRTASELVQPAGIRREQIASAPIKHITDLK